ncbi:MAG TPA: hypothetical protein VEC19_03960 [Usitatibacter sp.]|nr:hypothetical protein [Usitatibacter sp.]
MSIFQGFLFACLVVMVLLWFAGLRKLERLLRRHPATHERLGIEHWWRDATSPDESWDGKRPVVKVVRFIFGKGDRGLRDRILSGHVASLRRLGYAYVVLFVVLAISIVRTDPGEDESPAAADAAPESAPAQAVAPQARDRLAEVLDIIERQPTNFHAHVHADRILSSQRRWDELLELWGRYLERVPGDAEAWYERAGTNWHKGNRATAVSDLEHACKLGKAAACARASKLPPR